MLFPDSERVLYGKNPLAEVICQLRFPTILRISEGQLAEFQEVIRADYPVYTEQEPTLGVPAQLPKELSSIIEQVNFPIPAGLITHRFASKDGKRFIAIRSEAIAIAETDYKRWEEFKKEIVIAENALRKVYKPAYYSRVGLRYKNIISKSDLGLDGPKWKDLLRPHISAELGDKDVLDSVTRMQTKVMMTIPDIPNGQVVLNHGLIVPTNSDEECYLIDADFSVESKEGVDEPFDVLGQFNRMARRLFRWAITEQLHGAMEPGDI